MTGPPLRVSSWNIRNGLAFAQDRRHAWWLRRRAVLDVIDLLDPDLLGLQEAYEFQLRYLSKRLPDHVVVGVGRTDGRRKGEQCPVVGRIARVELVDVRTYWFSDEPDRPGSTLPEATHPRIATVAQVHDLEAGQDFHVANLHLDQRHQANRLRSIAMLVEWMADRHPLIVMGDLNVGPGSGVTKALQAAGLRSALPDDAPGTAHDWMKTPDPVRLDHIFVSEHWSVDSWAVPQDRPRGKLTSDHWPVSAVLSLVSEG